MGASAAQGATAAVLVPGSHEQAGERHGNQTEHDAAEQGFDHGVTHQRWLHNSFTRSCPARIPHTICDCIVHP